MKTSREGTRIFHSLFALSLLFAIVSSAKVGFDEDYLFIQNSKSSSENEGMTLVVLSWPEKDVSRHIEDCEIFTDQELVSEILQSTEDPHIWKTTDDEIRNFLKDCNEIRSQFENGPLNPLATSTSEAAPSWPVIWPGTKWCGAGDIAKNYDDLGLHSETDKCCRAHDLCDDLLIAGESRNNLTNNTPFTKLSCKCDDDFYYCLDRVDSVISNSIGNLYFNVMKTQCYVAEYPKSTKCKKYWTPFKLKCKEFERDTKAPKVYQWRKPKFYKRIPFPGTGGVKIPI